MAKGAYIGVEKTIYLNSLGDVAVGGTVKINENGSPVEFFVATHDYESELNGSGRTLLVRKTLTTEGVQWAGGTGGNAYRTGAMIINWFNNTYIPKLDTLVQENLSTTYIKSCDGNSSSNVSVVGFPVFALSVTELGLSGGDVPVEGSKLPIADTLRSLNDYDPSSGSGLQEWTRTPVKGDRQFAFYEYSGDVYQQYTSGYFYKLRPCFTLPASLGVGDDNLITGAQAESVTQPVARKIKKNYVGVNSVARKIKKAYVGIGGVARPCWSGGELAYYGTITKLSQARYSLAATTVGDYALFGGGETDNEYSNTVDAYNKSLVRSSPTVLSIRRARLSATTIGGYALFGGGTYGGTPKDTVDAYDTSLSRTTPSHLSSERYYLAATSVGNYALFGGGRDYYGGIYSYVDTYDKSLTYFQVNGGLSDGRYSLAATSVGNYALFGGGSGSSVSAVVDAYNASLTRTTPTAFSVARQNLSATTVGNYALFGGGYNSASSSAFKVIDAYNESLTRTVINNAMSTPRINYAATTVGDYALFGGSAQGSGGKIVDAFDKNLTRTNPTSMTADPTYLAATTVGNYALFGGGQKHNSSTNLNTVEVYTVA